MGKNQHVVPHDNGWVVKPEGGRNCTSVFDTKQDAIDAGRSMADSQGGELIVHGRGGQIFRSTGGSDIGEETLRAAVRSVSGGSSAKRAAKRKSVGAKKSAAAKKSGAKKSAAKKSSRKR